MGGERASDGGRRAGGALTARPATGAVPGPSARGRDVFITGATGFIGSRLAAALIERGDHLRCLVRDTARARHLEERGARLIQGDVTDDIALQYGLDGADLAYHLAAIYDIGVVDEGSMERVNVDGTRAVLLVSESQRTPHVVHVSSTAALPPAAQGESQETVAFEGPYPSRYHRTKAHAHRLALRAQERGQPVTIVCPSMVYGPGDHGPGGRFLLDMLRGRIPALLSNPGWYSYVHVDDVVRGLVAVGDRGPGGGVYVLSGEPLPVNDYALRAARLAGVRAPPLRVPAAAARVTGTVMDIVARATRRRMPLSRESVDASTHRWVHAHDRASAELGWRPRPLEEGLPETVEWAMREIGRS